MVFSAGSRPKMRTKNFVGFHNHSPLLNTMQVLHDRFHVTVFAGSLLQNSRSNGKST